MDITYDGINYFIPRNEEESEISLHNRMIFISKQKPKNEKELNKEIKFGNIYVNKKLLNCEYSSKIENILNEKCKNL